MKFFTSAALLAAVATAIVLPDESIEARLLKLSEPEGDSSPGRSGSGLWDIVKNSVRTGELSKKPHCKHARDPLDKLAWLTERENDLSDDEDNLLNYRAYVDSWLTASDEENTVVDTGLVDMGFWELPHWGPPHRRPGPPGKKPPHGKPPPHKRPHKRPHHHFDTKNFTIYELITKTNRTEKLAKLIKGVPSLVETLNSTELNYTLFIPPQSSFDKIPKNISKEFLGEILSYHVAEGVYYPGKLFFSHTIPTALNLTSLGGEFQRIRVNLGLLGIRLNFFARLIRFFIPAKNGGITGVSRILLPPPPAWVLVKLLPIEFSQLQLALDTTGLESAAKKSNHTGGTFFAPTNAAFSKLGHRLNAFLFSERGKKYLRALLTYHIVLNQTLYSDAYVAPESNTVIDDITAKSGYFHVDLPTLLHGKPIAVDVRSWGPKVSVVLNGYTSVAVVDGIANDGVVHVLKNILLPPRPGHGAPPMVSEEDFENMSIEDFKSRFPEVEEEGDLIEQVDEAERIEL